MRQVQVFKWEREPDEIGRMGNVRRPDFIGILHQFGQDDNGEGQSVPVAIVEAPDGRVHSIYAEMVQFITPAAPAMRPATAQEITLRNLDGYMSKCGYEDTHPWRKEIADTLKVPA